MPGLFDTLLQKIAGTPDSSLTDQSEGIINSLMEKVMRGEEGPITGRLAEGRPSIERGMAAMDKAFPDVSKRVKVVPNPELDWTPTGAQVPFPSHTEIQINEPMAQLSSMPTIEKILSHEMQHIRDNRDGKIDLSEFSLPYANQPHEIRAKKAANQYMAEREYGLDDEVDPFVSRSIIEWLTKSPTMNRAREK